MLLSWILYFGSDQLVRLAIFSYADQELTHPCRENTWIHNFFLCISPYCLSIFRIPFEVELGSGNGLININGVSQSKILSFSD